MLVNLRFNKFGLGFTFGFTLSIISCLYTLELKVDKNYQAKSQELTLPLVQEVKELVEDVGNWPSKIQHILIGLTTGVTGCLINRILFYTGLCESLSKTNIVTPGCLSLVLAFAVAKHLNNKQIKIIKARIDAVLKKVTLGSKEEINEILLNFWEGCLSNNSQNNTSNFINSPIAAINTICGYTKSQWQINQALQKIYTTARTRAQELEN